MTSKPFLVGFIGAALLIFYANENQASELPAKKPNIIFILADDLGYGDLGCFGQKKIKTPRLDQMAAEGMKFTDAYAGSTVCAPSRCTLMTGFHTGHAQIRGNGRVSTLDDSDVTVAQLLKPAGYATALIGKWGLGEENQPGAPAKKGFDLSFGYLNQTHAHNYFPEYLLKNGEKYFLKGNVGGAKVEYAHDLFTAAALDYLKTNQHNAFFLYLAYTIPHANNELFKKTGNGEEVPGDAPYSAQIWPQVEKNKAAMITRMDADIGRLFEELKKLKLDKNTIVFFSSDNGPHKEGGVNPEFFHSSGAVRGTKRDLTEGGIREPTIARWPGKIKAGVTSDFPWAFWDFLPTACELARAKTPANIDGISILPTLLGKKQTPHEFFYWEFHEGGSQQAVRMGDWKAIRPVGGALELFNLKNDLTERHNVVAQHPDIVAKIENYLKTARSKNPNWLLKPAGGENKKKKSPPAAKIL